MDEFTALYSNAVESLIEAVEEIKDHKIKKSSLLRIANEIPESPAYSSIFKHTIKRTIEAANLIDDTFIRRFSLVRIADKLPKADDFIELRLHAMSLALGLSDEPLCRKNSLGELANELPKTNDDEFYRKNTFLGIANRLPKTGKFFYLYKKAIEQVIKAAGVINEPYYRKYALIFIAKELPKKKEFLPLYKKTLTLAFESSCEINDVFIKQYALMEVLEELPKTPDFYPLLLKIIEKMLPLYSVRSRMEDVRAIDVFDYIIVAEEKKMNESKKKRYTKENYAHKFSKELDKFGHQLNDIRFMEILRPYTHIWVRPHALRRSVKRVVDRLEGLKQKYHGKEIERPVFMKEAHGDSETQLPEKRAAQERAGIKDSIAIDLGATNTVIMRKKGEGKPFSVSLESISRKFGETFSIPTVLSLETNSIGTEASDHDPVTDIKRMLLGGNARGKEYMERYFRILYRHLMKVVLPGGWLKRISSIPSDKFYITVPVGFRDYRRDMKEILKKTFRGVKAELIDEPLAAAIGYQVADERDKLVMVIDFGGLTLDVMVLRLNINEVHVVGKPDRSKILGGRDIDIWLADYLAGMSGMQGKDIPPEFLTRAEEIKIALSVRNAVPFEWKGSQVCKVSRDDFEEILEKHDFYKTIDRTISNVLKKIKKIGIKKEKIECVLLTGGSSQIPSFKEKIGHTFPELNDENAIYEHSPLSAAAQGAALYGTKGVIDRHLGMAYAVRHKTKDRPYSYEIILEKGESLPLEKTFKLTPARTLGIQDEIYIELFEVPDSFITRRWERESGMEFIKQVMKQTSDVELKGFKILSLPFDRPVSEDIPITFCIDCLGYLKVRYGSDKTELQTGIRLQ
jgi:actin-like ATPase involved in cell morphogenesis